MLTAIAGAALNSALSGFKKYWMYILLGLAVIYAYVIISNMLSDNRDLTKELDTAKALASKLERNIEQVTDQSIVDSEQATQRINDLLVIRKREQLQTQKMIQNSQGRASELTDKLEVLHEKLKITDDKCVNADMPDPIIRLLFGDTADTSTDSDL